MVLAIYNKEMNQKCEKALSRQSYGCVQTNCKNAKPVSFLAHLTIEKSLLLNNFVFP